MPVSLKSHLSAARREREKNENWVAHLLDVQEGFWDAINIISTKKDPAARYMELQNIHELAKSKKKEITEHIEKEAKSISRLQFWKEEVVGVLFSVTMGTASAPGGVILALGCTLWARQRAMKTKQGIVSQRREDLKSHLQDLDRICGHVKTAKRDIEKNHMAGVDASPMKWRALNTCPYLKNAFLAKARIPVPATAQAAQSQLSGPTTQP